MMFVIDTIAILWVLGFFFVLGRATGEPFATRREGTITIFFCLIWPIALFLSFVADMQDGRHRKKHRKWLASQMKDR